MSVAKIIQYYVVLPHYTERAEHNYAIRVVLSLARQPSGCKSPNLAKHQVLYRTARNAQCHGTLLVTVDPSHDTTDTTVMAGRQRDLPARLGSLSLVEKTVASPDPDVCLAHLRLLTAFEKLQSCVGFQDGLWDVWDNRASSADNPLDIIVNLREKRWAVFVARAVDRYENWWRAFGPDMLLEKDMLQGSGSAPEKYESFFEATPLAWKPDMLPPLGKLHNLPESLAATQ